MDEVLDELETVETPRAAVSSVENGFGHKILHLDCGRKYFTKEWVIALIHEMTAAGYNEPGAGLLQQRGLPLRAGRHVRHLYDRVRRGKDH